MKRKRLILLLLVLVWAGSLAAHAPKDMMLEFRAAEKSLTIKVEHPVSNSATHFIETLNIRVNGTALDMPSFTRQYSEKVHEVTVSLDEWLSDTGEITVSITASCSQNGELSEIMTLKPGKNALKSIGMDAQWQIQERNLWMSVQAPTTGWIAVGFDPEKMMKGANFIIGYVKDGTAVIRDDFGTGRIRHQADTDINGKDNILSFSGMETEDMTELTFLIPLDSGDPADKPITPDTIHTIMLAYGKKDSFNAKHSRDSVHQIKL